MKVSRKKQKKAFTLIELLIVIAIIGILSSVVLVSLTSARAKARDAERKSDLRQIASALELYYSNNNTYALNGYGYAGVGIGWLAYTGYGYPSVSQGLVAAGLASSEIVDPSGIIHSDGATQSGYLIQADANGFTLWANLENPSAEDIATQNKCRYSQYDDYYTGYPADARMNFCISN